MCNTSVHYHENMNTVKPAKFRLVAFSKTHHKCSFLLSTVKYHRLIQFKMNNILFSWNKAVGEDKLPPQSGSSLEAVEPHP